jgi:hypothetical protein
MIGRNARFFVTYFFPRKKPFPMQPLASRSQPS